MKANKAPEKIWINLPQDLPCGHIDSNSIEYTRTDAFIEKAVKWLDRVRLDYYLENNDELIEDFKNYMKGE